MNEPVMQFFTFAHLKEPLQGVSRPFCELAQRMLEVLPPNSERTKALDRLLEAKDAAVRAFLFKGGLYVPALEPRGEVPEPKPTAPA